MRSRILSHLVLLSAGFMSAWVWAADANTPPAANTTALADQPSGEDIVRQCNYKNPGLDQESDLTITLVAQDGSELKTVYHRYWKDYGGSEGVIDKMILFTEFPPDAKGTAFMRWAYTSAERGADQWLYLPILKKKRRISVRDPGDSFLGSDLTYWDIGPRALGADKHQILKFEEKDGKQYFLVESVPLEKDPLYSKRQSIFVKNKSWDQCYKARLDYYDKKNLLLKSQYITWQQVGGAWVWKEVQVQNAQTKHISKFQVDNVKVNTGLADSIFTERMLTSGGVK